MNIGVMRMSDTISRKATIDAMESVDWYHISKDGQLVHGANSAEHQALYKASDVYKVLNEMPSAQPERETAKFIRWMECKKTANYISYTPHCKCSKCGTEFLIRTIKYCYMCGARMEGE